MEKATATTVNKERRLELRRQWSDNHQLEDWMVECAGIDREEAAGYVQRLRQKHEVRTCGELSSHLLTNPMFLEDIVEDVDHGEALLNAAMHIGDELPQAPKIHFADELTSAAAAQQVDQEPQEGPSLQVPPPLDTPASANESSLETTKSRAKSEPPPPTGVLFTTDDTASGITSRGSGSGGSSPSVTGTATAGGTDSPVRIYRTNSLRDREDALRHVSVDQQFPSPIHRKSSSRSVDEFEQVDTLVLDVGTSTIKAGFSGTHEPRYEIPSIVGHASRIAQSAAGPSGGEDRGAQPVVGAAVRRRRSITAMTHVIDRGIITQWDDLDTVLRHLILEDMHVDPAEHPTLITEPVNNPRSTRERLTQIMFEGMYSPALFLLAKPVASLYGSGRTTGCVLQTGEGLSQIASIYDGYAIASATQAVPLAGKDVTERLLHLQQAATGLWLHSSVKLELFREVKEDRHHGSFVSLDLAADERISATTQANHSDYELPDGTHIHLGSERFRSAEVLFHPSEMGFSASQPGAQGLGHCIARAIHDCDVDMRGFLYSNIVVSGGNSLLPNFVTRLTTEVGKHIPAGTHATYIAPAEARHLSWIGAAILGSLNAFAQMRISRAEYDECGPSIVHRKCF